ncbi:hypothetical protein [Fusobacterium sp. PH5-44]|uniref:hypothetical protein n=1 Tax=unclassified Fusobacterium TaxID=2648384 RepID=UPI003D260D2A
MAIKTEAFRKALNDFYSKEVLFKLYKKYYLEWIADGYIGNNLGLFEISMIGEKSNKETFLDLLEQIFTNEETFNIIYNTLNIRVKEVFKSVAWEGKYYIPQESREEFFNFENNYDLNKDLKDEFLFFKIEKDIRHEEYLYMDYDVIRIFRKFMEKPLEYNIIHQNELQITLVQNNEKEFLQNMNIYLDCYNQGEISLSSNGKILKESKINMKKYCNITEYYNNSRDLDYLKTETIGLFFFLIKPEYRDIKYFNFDNIKNLANDFLDGKLIVENEKFPFASLFLNFLKGVRNIWNTQEELEKSLATIKKIISEIGDNHIVSLENIIKSILYRDEFIEIINVKDAYDYIYINEANYERTKIPNYEKYISYVIEPFIKTVFFILGTLGLFELYYDYPTASKTLFLKNKYLSKYDGLKYVKLSELGKYVFGRTEYYNIDLQSEKSEVVLDEDRLIITIIGEDPMKCLFLEKISQKISANKFKLTEEQFLKGIDSYNNLVNKINDFKEKVTSEFNPFWEGFFENLRKKTNSINIQDNFTVLKLDNSKELMDVFQKEKKFKDLILKCEGYYILVKKENLQNVVDLFKEHGYYIYL